jgi:hypothetical protein
MDPGVACVRAERLTFESIAGHHGQADGLRQDETVPAGADGAVAEMARPMNIAAGPGLSSAL